MDHMMTRRSPQPAASASSWTFQCSSGRSHARMTWFVVFFFFNDTATTEIYTLSLHDALPIWPGGCAGWTRPRSTCGSTRAWPDRKSTRLNSSHTVISYAVFCLKKKTKNNYNNIVTKRKYNNTHHITTPIAY